MPRLSKKTMFAIEAVLDVAFHVGEHPVRSGDITERQRIPKRYLEQVLQHLVRAGILTPTTPGLFGTTGLAGFVAAFFAGLFVGTALVSIFWTPHAVDELQMRAKLMPSSAAYPLGTDHLGRDVLSRIMVGAQTSIAVGLIAVGIGMSAGVALGAWAAARGGWVDEALSRTSDLIFAFPAVLIAILITSVLGASAQNAILAIAIFNIPVFARVTRGAALSMWSRDFVRAATAMGQGPLGITVRHVLPNIASVLIVQATIQFAVAILAEAGLSYLGLGAQPPVPSWGRMLRDAQTYIFQAPELAIWPGLAIALAVLGLNMLGDGLRDLLDPRLRLLRVG